MADKNFYIPLSHDEFSLRTDGAETLDMVVSGTGGPSKYGIKENIKTDLDKSEQLDPNNLISSVNEHRISDGQKRYGTLGKTTSSKYPRPKTLFYVGFENNYVTGVTSEMSKEISKYVLSVDKPTITYATKKMNQYNRIKYVYEDVKYGQLKITFIDVKDNPVQQAFFQYLRYNNNDFDTGAEGNNDDKYKLYYDNNTDFSSRTPKEWGLNINSNQKMFKSITIYEMFLNNLMVYKIENPVLNNINFGSNKIGDYGYNEITVVFDVEGITNILDMKNINGNNGTRYDVIGEQIARVGGAELAHYLGMRWYEGLGASEPVGSDIKGTYKYWDNNITNKQETNSKIERTNNKLHLEQAERRMLDYTNYSNKTKYYWISDGIGTETRWSDIGKLFVARSKQLNDHFGF